MPTQSNEKNYTVSRTFTDTSGKTWNEGDEFTGDEKAVQNALRNGNIKEGQTGQPSQQPAQGQQTSQAQPKRT